MSDSDDPSLGLKLKKRKKKATVVSSILDEPKNTIIMSHDGTVDTSNNSTLVETSSLVSDAIETINKKPKLSNNSTNNDNNNVLLSQPQGIGINLTVRSDIDSLINQQETTTTTTTHKRHDITVDAQKMSASQKAQSKVMRTGPLIAQDYSRAASVMDYALDICKDYKLYGYCAWGDTCKFMHDRSEQYNSAAQDRLFQKKKQEQDDENKKGSKGINNSIDIPTECNICHKELSKPIYMTTCRHFFHENCILNDKTKAATCSVCGIPTKGQFKPGDRELEKMKQDIEKIKNEKHENNNYYDKNENNKKVFIPGKRDNLIHGGFGSSF